MNELREKIDAGRFIPAIDRRYPLTAIADAYRYVQTGEKASMVVIDVVRGAAYPALRKKSNRDLARRDWLTDLVIIQDRLRHSRSYSHCMPVSQFH